MDILPQELIDHIIDDLHEAKDQQALLACSQVSHSFLPRTRAHLFYSMDVNVAHNVATKNHDYHAFMKLIARSPLIRKSICRVVLQRMYIVTQAAQPGDPAYVPETLTIFDASMLHSLMRKLPSAHILVIKGVTFRRLPASELPRAIHRTRLSKLYLIAISAEKGSDTPHVWNQIFTPFHTIDDLTVREQGSRPEGIKSMAELETLANLPHPYLPPHLTVTFNLSVYRQHEEAEDWGRFLLKFVGRILAPTTRLENLLFRIQSDEDSLVFESFIRRFGWPLQRLCLDIANPDPLNSAFFIFRDVQSPNLARWCPHLHLLNITGFPEPAFYQIIRRIPKSAVELIACAVFAREWPIEQIVHQMFPGEMWEEADQLLAAMEHLLFMEIRFVGYDYEKRDLTDGDRDILRAALPKVHERGILDIV